MEYVYKSTEERVYVDRGLTVAPGDAIDWPDGPPADGHWVPTDATQDELDRLAAERAQAEDEPPKTGEQQSTETPPGESGTTDTPAAPAPARGRKKE